MGPAGRLRLDVRRGLFITLMPSRLISVSLSLVAFAVWAAPTLLSAAVGESRPRSGAVGMLDVTTVAGVDPTGRADSTEGLNRAIREARDSRPTRTVFFPSGTYRVSDTVEGVHNGRGHRGVGSIVLVGSTAGTARPVIRMADASPGFTDPARPKPVVRITSEIDGAPRITLSYGDAIRGIDVDLGQGNFGAVGVDFDAAQDCFFEDVLIEAREGFAGVTGIPGRNSPTVNVEVRGGRHGFYLDRPGGSLGATVAGVRFSGQSGPALVIRNVRGMAITGLAIAAERGPVIELRGELAENTVCPIVDGVIDLRAGGPVLANPGGRLLAALDLWVRGTDRLSAELSIPARSGSWTRVSRLVQIPEGVGLYKDVPIPAWALVEAPENGRLGLRRTRDRVLEAQIVDGPPPDVVARHTWETTPSFEDPDAVLAPLPEAGAADVADALQRLIDGNRKVFLPAGVYPVSRPLVVPAGHQLIGVPGLRSILLPVAEWRPKAMTWVIDTVDDPAAATLLMDVSLDTPDIDHLGAVRWRAGRNSIVRHVRAYLAAGRATTRLHNYRIEGGGGGRWYGVFDHAQLAPRAKEDDPEYRKFLVRGTTEPLAFYGLNIERGGRSHGQPQRAPYLEIVDAANVSVLGSKQESDGTSIRILRSRNLLLTAICALRPSEGPEPLVTLRASRDVAIVGCYWYGGTSPLLEHDLEGSTVRRNEFLGLLLLGDPRPRWPRP